MCPSEFVKIGSGTFLFLGLLGIVHVLGPTEAGSIFGTVWWLDWTEICVFLLIGAVLFCTVRSSVCVERPCVLEIGWFLLFLSVWSLFFNHFFTIHFERPVEPLFFFLMGIWAHMSGLCSEQGEKSDAPT